MVTLEDTRNTVEPPGAASFAAVISGKLVIPDNSRAVCVRSCGNVDFGKMMKHLAT